MAVKPFPILFILPPRIGRGHAGVGPDRAAVPGDTQRPLHPGRPGRAPRRCSATRRRLDRIHRCCEGEGFGALVRAVAQAARPPLGPDPRPASARPCRAGSRPGSARCGRKATPSPSTGDRGRRTPAQARGRSARALPVHQRRDRGAGRRASSAAPASRSWRSAPAANWIGKPGRPSATPSPSPS